MRELDVMELYAVGGGVGASGTFTVGGNEYDIKVDASSSTISIGIGGTFYDFASWLDSAGQGFTGAAIDLVNSAGQELSNAWDGLVDMGRSVMNWLDQTFGFGSHN